MRWTSSTPLEPRELDLNRKKVVLDTVQVLGSEVTLKLALKLTRQSRSQAYYVLCLGAQHILLKE